MGGVPAKIPEEFNHPDFAKRLKAGNESAFREFFDYFSPWAKSLIKRKYGLSEEDAKDITQDFFRRIVEKIKRRSMMKEKDKDLAAFEEYLFSFMNDATPSIPLTNDEVVAILQNYGPPEKVAPEEKEQIVKLMKETHSRRMEIARKMQNPSLIHSLGELFQLFCDWKHTPSAWLARLLNLTEEQFEAHRKDRVSPVTLGKNRILNFAALAGMNIQDMAVIIEKTIKLLNLKPTTNFAAGHTRAYKKEASESELLRVRDDATKELLLKPDEPKQPFSQDEHWEDFRRALLQEDSTDKKLFDESAAERLLPRELLKSALQEGSDFETLQKIFQVSRHVVAMQLGKYGFLTRV